MSGSGSTIKVIIAVVLFVIAGVIFVHFRGGSEAAKEMQSPSDLICTKCNHTYQMAGAEAAAAFKAAPSAPAAGGSGEGEGSGTRFSRSGPAPQMIKCPKCGETSVVHALKCEKHGEFFPAFMPD